MKRPTVTHRLQHILFLLVAGIATRLPERAALGLGTGLGWLVGSVLRIRRRVAEENLARAFPGRSPGWCRKVAAASFRHLGRESVSLLRLPSLGREELRARCRMEGLEVIREALSEGRGVLLLAGHFGNWEIGGASLAAYGIPLQAVVRAQKNPLFDAHLRRTRERIGVEVVVREAAARELLRSLRAPRVVALVADQNVTEGGIFVDFFGFPAATARGPATLALRTRATVVMADAVRIPGRHAHYRIRFERIPVERTGEAEADLHQFTRRYMQALEAQIEKAPEQYFWLHRRWKTRPEGSEPPSVDSVSEPPQRGRPSEHRSP